MEDSIRKILAKAVTAPSGDNSQPWWFHIDNRSIEVNLYPTKDNKILNFELSGSYIAIGALIENIAIAASHEKFAADIVLFPDSSDVNLIARITLNNSEVLCDDLYGAMDERTTNRKPYHKKPIASDILDRIRGIDDRVRMVTDREAIIDIANASSVMERVALETESIHKLFFESIVWSEAEEREKGMGLPIKTTELPPPIQLLFRAIRHWKIANALNHVGLSFLASKANAQTYASAEAIGIVVADKFDKFEYVKAGRLFQRVWLTATKAGLAFQPVTGLLFLAQRVLVGQTDVFMPKHIPMIKSAFECVLKRFDLRTGTPAMLFRIGYADAPSARTIRKAPEIR